MEKLVFTKEMCGNEVRYFVCDEDGSVGIVPIEWILLNQNEIVNVRVEDDCIYPVVPESGTLTEFAATPDQEAFMRRKVNELRQG